MRKRLMSAISRPLALVVVMLLVPSVAYAAYCEVEADNPPYYPPAPTVSPSTVAAGEEITVSGTALPAGWYTVVLAPVGDPATHTTIGPTTDIAVPDSWGNIPPEAYYIPIGIAGTLLVRLVNQETGTITEAATVSVEASPSRPQCVPPYRGGLYKATAGSPYYIPPREGCQRHHMPSKWSAKGIASFTANCTPAIEMVTADHYVTGSFGGGPTSERHRFRIDEQNRILAFPDALEIGYKDAFEKAATDVRVNFPGNPGKYDNAIDQARVALNSLPSGGTSFC